MNKFLIIISFSLLFCKNALAQSDLDIYNIYDAQIFETDTIAKKHNIKSITEYSVTLNGAKAMHSYKNYRDGYLLSYRRKFLKYPFIVTAAITKSDKTQEVLYRLGNNVFQDDSLFFNTLFGEFISESVYRSVKGNLILKVIYNQNDTAFRVSNYLNGNRLGEGYSIFDPNGSAIKTLNKPRRLKKSSNRTDTLITIDTVYKENYKSIEHFYNTIYDKPICEERISYWKDSIVDKFREVREYDNMGRMVSNSVFTTMGDVSKYVLNKSEKTDYQTNGNYTVYEDKFLADGKPDIITSYNSNGNIIVYKRYYSEGGFSKIKYVYNKKLLLLSSTFYVDGKYNGKTFYVYSFAK